MMTTYKNEENGLEAIVTEGNAKHSHRVIFRDTDANETLSVRFGTLDYCDAKAQEFVK